MAKKMICVCDMCGKEVCGEAGTARVVVRGDTVFSTQGYDLCTECTYNLFVQLIGNARRHKPSGERKSVKLDNQVEPVPVMEGDTVDLSRLRPLQKLDELSEYKDNFAEWVRRNMDAFMAQRRDEKE